MTAGLIIGIAVCALEGSGAWAQEKRQVLFRTPAENTKYTQQYAIDVGDMPGHAIRIYEVRRVYPENAPVFEGARLKEVWRRGFSDYVHVDGRAWGYDTYVMESGERVFVQWSGTSAVPGGAEKGEKSHFSGVLTITGGTGRFLGIRGTLRETVVFSPASGFNEARTEGEYWIER